MTTTEPQIVNEMSEVRVGRFRSRMVDNTMLRQGVKDHRCFREIYYMDEEGNNLTLVCFIETFFDETWLRQNERMIRVMKVLDAGANAIKEAE